MDYRYLALTELEFMAGHFMWHVVKGAILVDDIAVFILSRSSFGSLGQKGAAFYFRSPAYDAKKHQELLNRGQKIGQGVCIWRCECIVFKLTYCVLRTAANKYVAESPHAEQARDDLKRKVRGCYGRKE